MLMQIVGKNQQSGDAILRNVGFVALMAGGMTLGAAGAIHFAELETLASLKQGIFVTGCCLVTLSMLSLGTLAFVQDSEERSAVRAKGFELVSGSNGKSVYCGSCGVVIANTNHFMNRHLLLSCSEE